MIFFEFEELIEEFSTYFTMQLPVEIKPVVEYDNLGRLVNKDDVSPPVDARGALVPLTERVIYQSGGRLTEADRQLYSLDPNIPKKTKIFHKGMTYHVESKVPYEEFSDFSLYVLKAVSAFD